VALHIVIIILLLIIKIVLFIAQLIIFLVFILLIINKIIIFIAQIKLMKKGYRAVTMGLVQCSNIFDENITWKDL